MTVEKLIEYLSKYPKDIRVNTENDTGYSTPSIVIVKNHTKYFIAGKPYNPSLKHDEEFVVIF